MHTFITRLARGFAILGGLVLSTLIVTTCLSIAGRSINSLLYSDIVQNSMPGVASALLATGVGPINGDFELVEAGMAFALFAFLPLCQLSGSHPSVDILTASFPRRINQSLRMFIEAVFAVVLIIIAIQLFAGMESKRNSGQTTLLLEFPVWWGYALSVPGAIAAAIVSVHIAVSRLIELTTDRVILVPDVESDH